MDRLPAARLLLALAVAGIAPLARAALGEPASSISADETAVAATRRQRLARGTHAVEELVSDARTVREYVSPSGLVFAVTWEGVTPPDLSVLGAYEAPVRRAMTTERTRARSRAIRVEAAGAVVETWGHMRSLHGRAYVPALVPAGVRLDEIK